MYGANSNKKHQTVCYRQLQLVITNGGLLVEVQLVNCSRRSLHTEKSQLSWSNYLQCLACRLDRGQGISSLLRGGSSSGVGQNPAARRPRVASDRSSGTWSRALETWHALAAVTWSAWSTAWRHGLVVVEYVTQILTANTASVIVTRKPCDAVCFFLHPMTL